MQSMRSGFTSSVRSLSHPAETPIWKLEAALFCEPCSEGRRDSRRQRAHILALGAPRSEVYNLGTGGGASVREVIDACSKITGKTIDTVEKTRRPGDPPRLIASSEKIKSELGWRPQFQSLDEIIESAWTWHHKFPNGYGD